MEGEKPKAKAKAKLQTTKPAKQKAPPKSPRNKPIVRPTNPLKTGGKKTILTKELQDRLLALIREGNYMDTACNAVGIATSSIYNWRNKGEAELQRREDGEKPDRSKQPYVDFVLNFTRAEAESEAAAVLRIRSIVKRTADDRVALQGEMFLLERRWPKRWGRRTMEIESKVEAKVEATVDGGDYTPLVFRVPIPEGMQQQNNAGEAGNNEE